MPEECDALRLNCTHIFLGDKLLGVHVGYFLQYRSKWVNPWRRALAP